MSVVSVWCQCHCQSTRQRSADLRAPPRHIELLQRATMQLRPAQEGYVPGVLGALVGIRGATSKRGTTASGGGWRDARSLQTAVAPLSEKPRVIQIRCAADSAAPPIQHNCTAAEHAGLRRLHCRAAAVASAPPPRPAAALQHAQLRSQRGSLHAAFCKPI